LSERAFTLMTTPFRDDYTYGLRVRTVDGDTIVRHDGAIAGFFALMEIHMCGSATDVLCRCTGSMIDDVFDSRRSRSRREQASSGTHDADSPAPNLLDHASRANESLLAIEHQQNSEHHHQERPQPAKGSLPWCLYLG
jgi:hypothetical protein